MRAQKAQRIGGGGAGVENGGDVIRSLTQLLVNLECSFVSRNTPMLYSAIKRKLT